MAAAKPAKRNKKVADGWDGFPGRLNYAIEQRQLQARRRGEELTQNAVALAAGLDSGQLSKILSGERAHGVAANTVLLLANALHVSAVWLLSGIEPSGVSAGPEQTVGPEEPPPASSSTSDPPPRRRAATQ